MQGDLIGIMHEAVQDRIGECRIPQGLMPVLHGQLTGDDRSASPGAIHTAYRLMLTPLNEIVKYPGQRWTPLMFGRIA